MRLMNIRDVYEKHGYYVDKEELINELLVRAINIKNEIERLEYEASEIKEDLNILENSENLKYDAEKDEFEE